MNSATIAVIGVIIVGIFLLYLSSKEDNQIG